MLILTLDTITEAGGTGTVTARLNRASAANTTVRVQGGDGYALGVNIELTIPAGETLSAGSVTITALDNNLQARDRRV